MAKKMTAKKGPLEIATDLVMSLRPIRELGEVYISEPADWESLACAYISVRDAVRTLRKVRWKAYEDHKRDERERSDENLPQKD